MSLQRHGVFCVGWWIMTYWITQCPVRSSWTTCSKVVVNALSCAPSRRLAHTQSFAYARVRRNEECQCLYMKQRTHQFSTSQGSAENTVTTTAVRRNKKINNRKPMKEELFRADRVLSNRTGKSRSECFELLKKKRVWQVVDPTHDNAATTVATDSDEPQLIIVAGPSSKLPMFADLRIDREHVVPMPPPLLMAFHKPKWVLSVRSDPYDRPCVKDVLPDMHPVGRLDYDTSGLLLFSSSGALTQYLLHPKHEIEKEYVAVVTGQVDAAALRAQLDKGVETTEGIHTAKLLQVVHFSQRDVQPYLAKVRDGLPSEYNQTDLRERGYLKVLDATELSTVRLAVTEGKHRMVRRILNNCGHPVVSLKREQFGMVSLSTIAGKELPEGQTRALSTAELEWAKSLIDTKRQVKPKYVAKKDQKRRERRLQ